MKAKGMSMLRKCLPLLGLLVLSSPTARAQVVEYYHLDAVGNIRAITDVSGNVIERHDYLPFGEECLTGPCVNNPQVGAGQPRKFTGKERDAETGLDYFGARYYGSKIGRFTTVDPVYTWRENLVDPQRWNRYAYGPNNPLRYVDPDGRDAIAVAFPDYKISVAGTKVGGLGHAGVVTIDSSGRTAYFEYGRYPGSNTDAPPGRARQIGIVDVTMGADGNPTAESMQALMKDLSVKAGQGGRVEGAYFESSDAQTRAMNVQARTVKSQNESAAKQPYSLTGNNCGTFVNDVLGAGGVNTPWLVDPRPRSMIGEWQTSGARVSYDPSEKKGP
jgi:RHS repeat-associated protein